MPIEEEKAEAKYVIPEIEEVNFHEFDKSEEVVLDDFSKSLDFVKGLSGVSSNRRRSINTLEKRFEGQEDAGSKQVEFDQITGYNAFDVVLPPHNMANLIKLTEISFPHHAAIEAKVSNIVGLGYDFIPSPKMNRKADDLSDAKADLDKFRKKLARTKDAFNDWLDELNKEDTFQEVLNKLWRDYEATGNAYLEIGRKSTGEIGYLGVIPAGTMRIRRDRDGFVQIISNKITFFANFGAGAPTIENPNERAVVPNPVGNDPHPNEVIHFKKSSPSSTFYGVPDIIPAQNSVLGLEYSDRFNLDYFENKAVPRHLITLQGATMNPALAANVMEFFETGLKGKNHRSLYIPLPSGTKDKPVKLEIEPIEAGIQDSSFNNYQKSAINRILMSHRVPISKVGLAEGVSLAVARDADKTFKEQVCQPEQKILEKKLNRVFKTMTDMFLLKLNEMSLTDENTQSQIDERRRKTGVETANEQRIRRGMPGLPGGDELVDLNAQSKKLAAENNADGNRERDAQRSAATTDNNGEGRQTQGEGRTNNVK